MNYIPQKKRNNKKLILLVLTIIMCLGVSYAAIYFVYFKEDSRINKIETGLVTIDYVEGNGEINLTNTLPVLDEVGLASEPYSFTVKNTSAVPINLKVELIPDSENTLHEGAIRYGLYKDGELIQLDYLQNLENNILYLYQEMPKGETIEFKLYIWVDYYYETPNETFKAQIKVTGESYDVIYEPPASVIVANAIANKKATNSSCTNITVEEDGITYLSGDNTCIDFNYVWYSGKLWRITAINADGTMKMITQDNITSISYGEDYNFYTDESTSSWIYQWLNEDFLDTLYNYENIIVTDYEWNVTSGDGTISTKLAVTTMVPAKVGLLNSYEYYKSYENLGSYSSGYLNIGYFWWLSNPYNSASSSEVWTVNRGGYASYYNLTTSAYGVRPSINLKSDIQLSGTGTKSDPYRIKGDKEEAVENTTLLNTRSSGEYVNFDGDLYRIVGIENNTTKINKVENVRDESNTVINKYFASTTTYGLSTNTQSDNYWDYYLNNTWYNSITSNYKSMLEKGTYYLGTVSSSARSYKLAICASASNTVTTKDCTKTSSTWTGYIGLPRYGEMFSSQLGSGSSTSSNMWLITPYSTSDVRYVVSNGDAIHNDPSSWMNGSRPSVNLKSTLKITEGNGTESSPFEISL